MPQFTDEPLNHQERCLAYLLGEMDVTQRSSFEADLEDDSLQQALLNESELLLQVADGLARDAAPSPALSRENESRRPEALSVSRFSLILTVLAATVLVAGSISFSFATRSELDPFQLADTWVQTAWVQRVDVAPIDQNGIHDSIDALGEFNGVPDSFEGEIEREEIQNDQSIEWMVVAMEASQNEGEQNGS